MKEEKEPECRDFAMFRLFSQAGKSDRDFRSNAKLRGKPRNKIDQRDAKQDTDRSHGQHLVGGDLGVPGRIRCMERPRPSSIPRILFVPEIAA
jgi:hypothetical protein